MFRPLADFADQHEDLDTAFRSHQVALMSLDLGRARAALSRFAGLLSAHMAVEEEILIPAFGERAGDVSRMGPEMIRRDHRRLLERLEEIAARLEELSGRESVEHGDVIDLFDLELGFKRLLHHHDERERLGMFRSLDQELSGEELEELWRRVEAFRLGQVDEDLSRPRA